MQPTYEELTNNLFEQLQFLETLPDFSESCTTLYIFEAITSIKALVKANRLLEEEKAAIANMVVMEFSEDEKPIYTQGLHHHELVEVVTAERCTAFVNRIESLKQQNAELLKGLQLAERYKSYLPPGDGQIISDIIAKATS